jgi:hypothetical protein
MKQDQWARLYEEERTDRINLKKVCESLLAGSVETISLYQELVQYLYTGKVPLVISFNGYLNVYFIE